MGSSTNRLGKAGNMEASQRAPWVMFVPFSRLCARDNKDSSLLTTVSPYLEQSLGQMGPPSVFTEQMNELQVYFHLSSL